MCYIDGDHLSWGIYQELGECRVDLICNSGVVDAIDMGLLW